MAEHTLVGQRVVRIDSLDRATGQARCTGDLTLPRMLHRRVLRSPHARARILNIDTSKAERLCGVKAIRKAPMDDTPIMGRGSYVPKIDQTQEWVGNPKGQQAGTFSFGAVVAEVGVDAETSQVRVDKVTGAHDCGFAINAMAVEGQLEGSVASGGVGATLLEEHYWDGGQMLNASMLEYEVPLSVDTPQITRIIVKSRDPEGPFGAKEVGLWGSMSMFQAIGNAIYDAVGVWIKDFPITPDKVLAALEERNKD